MIKKITLLSPQTKALLRKEFLQIIRDPSAMIVAFLMPVMLTFLFGFALSVDNLKTRIDVVSTNYLSTNGTELLGYFMQNEFIKIVKVGADRKAAGDRLQAGRVDAVLIIPEDFEKNILAKNVANLELITDATEPNSATAVAGYVSKSLDLWLSHYNKSHGRDGAVNIDVKTRVWYNDALKASYVLGSGSIAMVLSIVCILLTAMVIAREWERGTMEALMASPLKIYEIALAKTLPYILLGMGALTISFIFVLLCFDVPFRGSVPLFMFVGLLYVISLVSTGLLVSIFARTQFNAAQSAMMLSFLPTMMLSGLVYEVGGMPFLLRIISHMFPSVYFVEIVKTIFMTGNVWSVILPNVAMIVVINFVILYMVMKKISKRLD